MLLNGWLEGSFGWRTGNREQGTGVRMDGFDVYVCRLYKWKSMGSWGEREWRTNHSAVSECSNRLIVALPRSIISKRDSLLWHVLSNIFETNALFSGAFPGGYPINYSINVSLNFSEN